jgi:myo-inositol-1(or 4)-monophosphatase
MKDLLTGLGQAVRSALVEYHDQGVARQVFGDSPGGDAQFDIDQVAEKVVWEYLRDRVPFPIAVYTEDGSFRTTGPHPEYVLVIDPIDGTRPASAHLEMGTVSIAAAPMGDGRPTIGDVTAAHVLEIKTGAWLYADTASERVDSHGYPHAIPRLSQNTSLDHMFWSIEFNGHPMHLMSHAYQHLVDSSANTGGIFIFNSASFSITRIVTGQLDAYVDIGNRLLRDHPDTEKEFLRVGRGNILHLFPYDIAASVLIARKAGLVITDAYGESLDGTLLLDLAPDNQRSCVAASTPELHAALLDTIRWDAAPLPA